MLTRYQSAAISIRVGAVSYTHLQEETKMSEEQKSKVQQVTVERLQCSHGQLIQVVSVFPVPGNDTPEDKLKALIDLNAQQGKLCA